MPNTPFEMVTPPAKKQLGSTGVIIAVLVVVLLGLGIFFGVRLVQQNQNVAERAQTVACPQAEECPVAADSTHLRNCTPPEADNSPDEQVCDTAGKVGTCGGTQYCCPSAGGTWDTNMSACAAATTPPSSGTVTCSNSGFSNNFDSTIDTSIWTVKGSASISSGVLVVTIPSGTPVGDPSALTSKKLLTGDFVATYDIPEITQSGSGASGGYVTFIDPDTAQNLTVGRKIDKNGASTIFANLATTGNASKNTTVNASDKISFKVERLTGKVKVYYKTSGDYQSLLSPTQTFNNDVKISFTGLNGGNPAPVTTIKFDNFSLSCTSSDSNNDNNNNNNSATTTPTPTATSGSNTQGTKTATPTAAATKAPVPVTGANWPTMAAGGVGALLIIGSILLAL